MLYIFLSFSSVLFSQNPPVAQDDVNTVIINTTLSVNQVNGLLANDTDADNDTLTVVSYTILGVTYNAGTTNPIIVNGTIIGTITINANGSYVFVPTAGYTGAVPDITYTITDGTATSTAVLLLTVEDPNNLLEIKEVKSCNQGYFAPTANFPDGGFKINYSVKIKNKSTARDYNPQNIISNINLQDDLEGLFGSGCVKRVELIALGTTAPTDFVNNPYPRDWNQLSINSDFILVPGDTFQSVFTPTVFNTAAIADNKLYPRQEILFNFCVTFDPFCNGRPNPIPSGFNLTFDNTFTISSNRGSDSFIFNDVTDFHTSEATLAAKMYLENYIGNLSGPEAEPDGTYDFTNTIIIKNDGIATANNINFNIGLGNFLNAPSNITFSTLEITQVSGPTVNINTLYNGDSESLLLASGNSLLVGETIVLNIHFVVDPLNSSTNINYFSQLQESMTQGPDDSFNNFNEFDALEKRLYSYVFWTDSLGDHLDRYYKATSNSEEPTSFDQCVCGVLGMVFQYEIQLDVTKEIVNIEADPNGILEQKEVTFKFTLTNFSRYIQVDNLQLTDDLNAICAGNIVSITPPIIISSTATTNPVLNTAYNGTSNINIFDGVSGLLDPPTNPNDTNPNYQEIVIELKVLIKEDCIGLNTATFSAIDPLNNPSNTNVGSVNVAIFRDTDGDSITNAIDIDDDNDGIIDTLEYGGIDPLQDSNGNGIPDYVDMTTFGFEDVNLDGINDKFDFDLDGVLNHLDLDSDNDGIFDIIEAGNLALDVNDNGRTEQNVGANGLDNTLETNDTSTATINYALPNTDGAGKPNYLDIDSDGDGIVDKIEGHQTNLFFGLNGNSNIDGIDTIYQNGIIITDTNNDGTVDFPSDKDGDLVPDYIDINSDNDFKDDYIEGWDFDNDGTPETIAINVDADGDGLDDAFDSDTTTINPTNGQVPTDFPNVDNPTIAELDWRELTSIKVIIDDVTVTEGQDLQFTIRLVSINNDNIPAQSATPIDLEIYTTDGAISATQYQIAISPFDYIGVASTDPTLITIPAGDLTTIITIPTVEDTIFELDELLSLELDVTSNNTDNTHAIGVGTIENNDTPPDLEMNDTIENEGDPLVHIIKISDTSVSTSSSTPIIIDIVTSENTAISPEDYTTIVGTFTINGTTDPDNESTQTSFSIPTIIDNTNEADLEDLTVVGTVTSNNVGVQNLDKIGVIVDIDPEPTVSIDAPVVVEGNNLVFTISLSHYNYQPIDLNIFTTNDSAFQPDDYTQVSTQITILENTLTQTVEVITIDDNLVENPEKLTLNGVVTTFNTINNNPTNEGTILDNDFPNLFSPNNDGLSDEFEIIALKDYPDFILNIYDRWGSEVYQYSNKGNLTPIWWDGTYKGSNVPEGVYYYTLDYNDRLTKPKSGFIQLVR